jgi:carbonic anhydrase
MRILHQLFEQNRLWAAEVKAADPHFFATLAQQQHPEYLWIGCSDSRVPANKIVNMLPGQLFVHRNIANLVLHTDLNCLSVIQYAVEVLKVRHCIICGHYGCGGVRAALEDQDHGLIDNWIQSIKALYRHHKESLDTLAAEEERVNRLCELNVKNQVINTCYSTVVQNAWKRGQELTVHGWIYRIEDGLLRDLNVCVTSEEDLAEVCRQQQGGNEG